MKINESLFAVNILNASKKIIDKNVKNINTTFYLIIFLKGEIIGRAFENQITIKDKFEGIKKTIINKNIINTILANWAQRYRKPYSGRCLS